MQDSPCTNKHGKAWSSRCMGDPGDTCERRRWQRTAGRAIKLEKRVTMVTIQEPIENGVRQ